jgi:hydrogenase assembly chaperone HypC/HupF
MCITAPGQVVGLDAGVAVVETAGRRRCASTVITPEIAIGDWVIVGAGTILRRLAADVATELVRTIDDAAARTEVRARQPGDVR